MWNPFKKKISPEEAYKSNFFLAFDFIPMIIGLYNNRKVEENALSDIDKWRGFLERKLNVDMKFDWSNTHISTTDVNNNPDLFITLIRFSEPHIMAVPKAGLILTSRSKHNARFFTLECSLGGNMVCECVGKNHSNHGITLQDSDDLTPFLTTVLKIANVMPSDNNRNGLKILYFYMKSKMMEMQDSNLKDTPLILPVKKVDLDEDEVLQVKYNIRNWPTFVLIDSKGNEIHRWQGLSKGDKINSDLRTIINK